MYVSVISLASVSLIKPWYVFPFATNKAPKTFLSCRLRRRQKCVFSLVNADNLPFWNFTAKIIRLSQKTELKKFYRHLLNVGTTPFGLRV